jgi:glutamyl-tRNA reductase
MNLFGDDTSDEDEANNIIESTIAESSKKLRETSFESDTNRKPKTPLERANEKISKSLKSVNDASKSNDFKAINDSFHSITDQVFLKSVKSLHNDVFPDSIYRLIYKVDLKVSGISEEERAKFSRVSNKYYNELKKQIDRFWKENNFEIEEKEVKEIGEKLEDIDDNAFIDN